MIQANAVVKEQRNNHKNQSNDVVKKWEEISMKERKKISMKKLSGLTFRYMRYNRKRTLTTLVGVILSAILIYAVFGGGYSIYYNQSYDAYKNSTGWDAEFVCDGETAKELLALAGTQNKEYHVENAWIIQYNVDGNPVLPWGYVSDFSAMPEQFHLTSGVLPKNENELIVSREFALAEELDIGDEYTVSYLLHPDAEILTRDDMVTETKRVCGIFRDDYSLDRMGMNGEADCSKFVLMPQEAYTDIEIPVYIRFDDRNDMEEKAENLAAGFSIDDFRVSELARSINISIENNAPFLGTILLLAFVIECLTLLIIRNAFNISIHERNKDYGILRCVGMSRRQIIYCILTEAFWLALTGVLLGILFGHILISVVFGIVKRLAYVSFTLEMHFFRQAFLMTILFVFIGTAYAMVAPIEKLYRLNPIAAMNRRSTEKKRNYKIKPNRGRFLTKKFGFEVGYAYKTAWRSKGRFLVSVITLTIGTALFVGLNNSFDMSTAPIQEFVHSQSIRNLYMNSITYDEANSVRQDLLKMDAVKGVEIYSVLNVYGREEGDGGKCYLGLSRELYQRFNNQDADTDMVCNVEVIPVTKQDLSEKLTDKIPHIGDEYGNFDFYVYSLDENQGMIDMEKYQELLGDEEIEISSTGYSMAAEMNLSKSMNQIDRYCMANNINFSGSGDYAAVQDAKGTMIMIDCILVVFLIVFVVNMINIECSQLLLRRKELDVLRTIGMAKKQIGKMLYAESLLVSVLAWLIGSLIGCLLSFGWYLVNRFLLSTDMKFFHLHISAWSILIPGILLTIAAVLTVVIAREEE